MTVQIPAQIDPSVATIEFDYDMVVALQAVNGGTPLLQDNNGKIRIWIKDGPERRNGAYVIDDPADSGDFIETNRPIKVTDLGSPGSTITLYIEGVVEANFVHNYADVKAHDRPTNSIVVKLCPNGSGGVTITDTVQYIVADTELVPFF